MFFLRVRNKEYPSQVFDAISQFLLSESCHIVSFTQSKEYLVFKCNGHLTKFKLCLSPDMNHVIEDISKNIEDAFKIKCIFNTIDNDSFLRHCIIRNVTFSGAFSGHRDWLWWKETFKQTPLSQWQLMWSQHCILCTQVKFADNTVHFTLSGAITTWHFTIIICGGAIKLYKGNVVCDGLRLLLKQ